MSDKTIIQHKRSEGALLPETKSQQKFLKDFFKSFLKLILFFYFYINSENETYI